MSYLLLWTLVLGVFHVIHCGQRPPEAIVPGENIKPLIKLSLLSPEEPREGDDVQLQCSAKPKNGSGQAQPGGVHWIKGNVGVPEGGHKPEAVRFVREKSEEKGQVVFTLTIKEAEVTDADKYMCIVQVGEKGYFTSNEVDVTIKPGDPEEKKKRVEAKEEKKEQDLQEILKWRDRIEELSQEELAILADALVKDKERKEEMKEKERQEEQKKAPQDKVAKEEKKPPTTETLVDDVEDSLTEEEKSILERRDDLLGMSEIELFKLSNALKKERVIKGKEEKRRQKEEEEKKKKEKEKREKKWKEDLEREKREKEEKARREAEKKREEEIRKLEEERLKLTDEEKAILKRKDELPDFSVDEIKLLHKALAKEKDIETLKKGNDAKKEEKQEDKDNDLELTEEEEAILARKDEMRAMSQDELKIMARAVTKQKKIQEERKKKFNIQIPDDQKKDDQNEQSEQRDSPRKDRLSLDEQAKEPITGEELKMLLQKDDVMNLSSDELPILARGLKKQQYLQDNKQALVDDMTSDDMFRMLDRKDEVVDMNQDDLDSFMVALIKERQIKYGVPKEATEDDTKKTKTMSDDVNSPITNEELLMLTKKDDIMNLANDELPILARALKKQKAIEEKDPFTGSDMSVDEMKERLSRKDRIMDMEQEELDSLFIAIIKQRNLYARPPTRPEDEMSEEDMREILKWQDGDVSKLTTEQFRLLGTALLKEKKLQKSAKKSNDPLEEEEVDIHDEL